MSENDPIEDKFLESEESASLTETQETLTLLESQFDDEDEACEAEHKTMKKNVEAENGANEEVPYHTQANEARFNNTEDERFSQSNVSNESTFEVDDDSQDDSARVEKNDREEQDNYMYLGQTANEQSQLSMEY
jgi:hypothetical protein